MLNLNQQGRPIHWCQDTFISWRTIKLAKSAQFLGTLQMFCHHQERMRTSWPHHWRPRISWGVPLEPKEMGTSTQGWEEAGNPPIWHQTSLALTLTPWKKVFWPWDSLTPWTLTTRCRADTNCPISMMHLVKGTPCSKPSLTSTKLEAITDNYYKQQLPLRWMLKRL